VRAIIKKPELLILDEAYQGFDKATIELCNYYLNNILPASTTLIFTSHYKEEMPECINKYLYLEKGKIIMHD
jgi:molybdate transport system ATP-binding protein